MDVLKQLIDAELAEREAADRKYRIESEAHTERVFSLLESLHKQIGPTFENIERVGVAMRQSDGPIPARPALKPIDPHRYRTASSLDTVDGFSVSVDDATLGTFVFKPKGWNDQDAVSGLKADQLLPRIASATATLIRKGTWRVKGGSK